MTLDFKFKEPEKAQNYQDAIFSPGRESHGTTFFGSYGCPSCGHINYIACGNGETPQGDTDKCAYCGAYVRFTGERDEHSGIYQEEEGREGRI